MKTEYSYKQGDVVSFDYAGIKGRGEIVGCAMVDIPLIGKHYMVKLEDTSVLDSEVYPFNTVSVPEHTFY